MKQLRNLFNFVLGITTCLLVVALSTPAFSRNAAPLMQPLRSDIPTVEQYAQADLAQAEASVIAQGVANTNRSRYISILRKGDIVPTQPNTDAFGTAGAVLTGNILTIRGDFRNLSSDLRDYATDPLDPPNPNITSAIHVHQGSPTENGPFQYALEVMLDDSGSKGRFGGEYTLTSEQRQALSDGMLYLDIHTTRFRAGELRGVLQPMMMP